MKRFWRHLGIGLCLAGLALGALTFRETRKHRELGEEIFNRVDAHENLRAADAAAIVPGVSSFLCKRPC